MVENIWPDEDIFAMEDTRKVLTDVNILGNGNLWLEKDLDLLQ
jgi:hypothetical protein